MDDTFKNRLNEIYRILEREAAVDIVVLNMRKTCSWADCLIVATALNPLHLKHLAKSVREYLHSGKNKDDAKWCMIDGGDIVVSIMESEARNFYALEELWYESERMDISRFDQSSVSS